MKKSDLLIFIPTLNEAGNIIEVIQNLTSNFEDFDLLIIDDGSTDGTVEKLESIDYINLILIKNKIRLGIGAAHINAINYAANKKYQTLLTLDGDGTHSGNDLKKLYISLFNNNCDLIIGSRFINSNSIQGWPISRIFLTNCSHLVTKFGLGLSYDCSSGCRGYALNKRDFSEITNLESKSYDFFFQSIFLLSKQKYVISEVPITLNKRASGYSKMSISVAFKSVFNLFLKIVSFRIFGNLD